VSDIVYSDCPECGSGNTVKHVCGASLTEVIYAEHYPNARDCLSCGNLWDEDLRMSQVRFSQMMLSLVGKVTP